MSYIKTIATGKAKPSVPAVIISIVLAAIIANFAAMPGVKQELANPDAAVATAAASKTAEQANADGDLPEAVSVSEYEAATVAGEAAVESDADSQAVAQSADYAWTEWNEDDYPNYYRISGRANQPYEVDYGTIRYNGFDSLGRTTYAVGYITAEMRRDAKARGRLEFNAACDNISGWGYNSDHNGDGVIDASDGHDYDGDGKTDMSKSNKNSKSVVDTTVRIEFKDGRKAYNGYFYNRSHLIADSLGGDAIPENLVTGTRTQNVGANDNKGGMGYIEERVRAYLDNNPNGFVYYAVTPVYEGDELVCRSTFVDVKSNDGSIDEHIEVFNAAAGYEIDYSTGTFRAI